MFYALCHMLIKILEDKNQAVVVTGAKGKPPPNTYKVCEF